MEDNDRREILENLDAEILVESNYEIRATSRRSEKANHMKSVRDKVQLKRFDVIEYKSDVVDEWKTVTILSRCKTSGSIRIVSM